MIRSEQKQGQFWFQLTKPVLDLADLDFALMGFRKNPDLHCTVKKCVKNGKTFFAVFFLDQTLGQTLPV